MRKTICVMIVLMLAAVIPCARAEQSSGEYISSRTRIRNASAAEMTNINLAVDRLNGIWVGYGEQYSAAVELLEQTAENGYMVARDGGGSAVTGGGIGQVVSTLYLALQKAGGISCDEIVTYGADFCDDYVDSGNDAVIVDSAAGADFVFTNYADDMYIEMWVTDGYIYCSLRLGVKKNSGSVKILDLSGGRKTRLVSCSCIPLPFSYDGELPESDENLLQNICLASDSITDTMLYPGDEFSFNEIVGPREEEYGYVYAVNGRGVNVPGGGVGQVASALWMAAADLDCVEILEKSSYDDRYTQSYVADPRDAVVTDYSADIDFRFRYIAGDGALTIYTYTEYGQLFCEIYQDTPEN